MIRMPQPQLQYRKFIKKKKTRIEDHTNFTKNAVALTTMLDGTVTLTTGTMISFRVPTTNNHDNMLNSTSSSRHATSLFHQFPLQIKLATTHEPNLVHKQM